MIHFPLRGVINRRGHFSTHPTRQTTHTHYLNDKAEVFICQHHHRGALSLRLTLISSPMTNGNLLRCPVRGLSPRLALVEVGDEILRQDRGFGGLCRQTVARAAHEQIVIGDQLGVHVGQLLAKGFDDAGGLAEELRGDDVCLSARIRQNIFFEFDIFRNKVMENKEKRVKSKE